MPKIVESKLIHLVSDLWDKINRKRKTQFVIVFFFIVLASIAEVISISAVLPFLAAITNPEKLFQNQYANSFFKWMNINDASHLLLPLTIIFIIASLISGILRFLLLLLQTRLSFSVSADFSYKAYYNTLYQSYAAHLNTNSSKVISDLNKAGNLANTILLPILTIISSFIILIMILSALIAINISVSIITITGFGIIYYFIIKITKKRLAKDSLIISKQSTNVIKALQEGLGGIRDVLLDGTQDIYCEVYKSADSPLKKSLGNLILIGGGPRYGIEALGMILIAILAFNLSLTSNDFQGVIPILGAIALGAIRILPILQQLFSSWTTIKGNESSLVDSLKVLNLPIPKKDNNNNPQVIFGFNLTIMDLNFSYNDKGPIILNHINFIIKKGTKVGFIGETGSGKSTLLDILMGLLKPNQGEILIDGIKIDLYNNRSWQKHIAHVPQMIYLADTSIAENIAFGIPFEEIDLERVKISAQKAQISETIEEWEHHYNTHVGERGVRLSGGQRQRIGIARALYKRADIIIFDEATSALDNKTEVDVMKSIEGLGDDLTILIVAHRLSTLKKCDVIYELVNGKIILKGNFNEVISIIN